MPRATTGPVRVAALSVVLSAVAGRAAFAAGMPQLQFNNPLTTGQVFWGAVIFLLLYLLLSRSALPRVGAVLAERRARIQGDLDAAKAARTEADRAVSELRAARRAASAEAAAIVDKVVAQARHEAAARTAEANARLEAEIARAEVEVETARRGAMGSIRGVATDTAEVLVGRLTGGTAAPAGMVEQKVDAALARRAA